jgi:transcriptional regulator with GAF, ATPase, and Fis domain
MLEVSVMSASGRPVRAAAGLSRERLEALYEVSRALTAELEWRTLVQKIVDVAVEAARAERGILFVLDEAGRPQPEVVRSADDSTVSSALGISRRILEHALNTGEATLSDDARSDARFGSPSVAEYNIVSFMCVPLRRGDRLLGTLYVDHRRLAELFGREDLDFLSALADISAVALENARLHVGLRREVDQLRRHVQTRYGFGELLGGSPVMATLIHTLERVADADATVLIQGENGTGKELVARALHLQSSRRDRPFVTVDCGSLHEHLAAGELFGFRRGAFTGASEDHAGLFEQAHGGTVFLDQIEDLPAALQPHLLRALQEGEVRRIGEARYRKVSWRAIAASRLDLAERVRAGSFREDLYYRLRVVPIVVPPLRQRADDIPLLAQHFLHQARERLGRGPSAFSAAALAAMEAHRWPGNVRELRHAIERAVLLARGETIQPEELALETAMTMSMDQSRPGKSRAGVRIEAVEGALREERGNVSRAAQALGITRRALQKIMKRQGLERERFLEGAPGGGSA